LSNEETVQPQDGRASEMIRSEPPEFLITKSVSMTCPLGTVPMSRVSCPISILGAATDLPGAAGLAACAGGAGLAVWACEVADAGGLDSAGFCARATPAARSAPTPSRPILRT
jgi:hypothetical protein